MKWFYIKIIALVSAACLLLQPDISPAQNNSSESEVPLTFRYRGIVSVYVTAYYKDGDFYLPVSQLFNVLEIDHNIDNGSLSVSGLYMGETEYLIDFNRRIGQAGNKNIELHQDDILISEIDFFIKPSVLDKLFGLTFTVDFNNLTLDLETEDVMPVVARYQREQKRKHLDRNQPRFDRDYYPLQYDRQYGIMDGGFMDYNISGIYTPQSQLFTFSNAIGMEIFGGDVQGNTFGSVSGDRSSFTTDNLRWRYVQRNSNLFSSATVGQTSSEGIASRSFTGAKITNKPVEPRLLFDRYIIDGNVPPQSEVELYLNNSLVDFQETDQSGNYRFVVPLTYGSTDYAVRIYRPSGQSVERSSRIQIPFDYVPPGEVDYAISGGQLDDPILGSIERGYIGEASLSAGITRWLTTRASAEYLSDFHDKTPSFTGTLNARLFSNYLISLNANSENFYRFTTSVIYGSGASWNLNYDYNPGDSRLYNIGGSDHQGRLNLFTPFRIGNVPLNMRWSSTYQRRGTSEQLRYRADLNTRLGRLNIRFGYQDQQAGELQLRTTPASRLTNSYTYSLGRHSGIPSYLKGIFVRGQLTYLPAFKQLEEVEMQLSRDFFQTGRVQLAYGHNFLGNFNSLSFNLTIDFNKVRSNTTTRSNASDYSISQNFRGSVALDPNEGRLMLNNRQQVGQSGAAVRLFLDNNNDGSYQEEIDDTIDDPAVRLNRSGGRTTVKGGVNYISQLLPYYRYDMEINKSRLSNPLLVPELENFSIVTDPNQFKTIEIPFYLSGVISGIVQRKLNDGSKRGISGLRLYLESRYDSTGTRKYHSEEIRTFSDGSFYTYEVPPGNYNLYLDRNQLEFINGRIEPDTMQVEVRSRAEGDFIDGLTFNVHPSEEDMKEESVIADAETPDEFNGDRVYQIQIGSYSSRERAENVIRNASSRLGDSFDISEMNNLFTVRGLPIYDRDEAVNTIISYHNSSYPDAALVITRNPDYQKPGQIISSGSVQLGAFQNKERAEKFAALSRIKLNRDTRIVYEDEINLYTVFIDHPQDDDPQQLKQILAKIKSNRFYSDAFIKETDYEPDTTPRQQRQIEFAYQVQIEGISEESEQAFMSRLLENDSDVELSQPEKDLFIFDNVSSWFEAQRFQKQLAQISSIGHPIVVLIEISLIEEGEEN